MIYKKTLLLFSSLFLSFPAFAANSCINDTDGSKGVSSFKINTALNNARDPLTRAFMASQNGTTGVQPIASCDSKWLSSVATTAQSISAIIAVTTETTRIKKACIQASLQRKVDNTGYICDGKKREAFENASSSGPCLNDKTLNFIHFSVNQAINCLSTGRMPIDSRFILKKINNETAFNFYLAYNGGVGMGQLTSDPVKELAGWKEGKKFIEGNGKSILESIVKSENPSCKPFAEVIKKELQTPPPLPGSSRNYCSWVSPGEGMARNLVYALGYYVYMRDEVIKPAIARRSNVMANNGDVVNYLTLVAYGPGGPAQARALISDLRLRNNSDPNEVRRRIIDNSAYVSATEQKMGELLANLKTGTPTADDKRGDTCVE